MAACFHYPKDKHVRAEIVQPWKTIARFKPVLRKEFYSRCVYCCWPDFVWLAAGFGVDHYRPKNRFPALVFEYSNLFYSCAVCNMHKRDYWPEDSRVAADSIPNPCDFRMASNLRYEDDLIRARTSNGEKAIEILRLNADDWLEHRRFARTAALGYEAQIREMRSRLSRAHDLGDLSLESEIEQELLQLEQKRRLLPK